jgi:WD40 repeat protein
MSVINGRLDNWPRIQFVLYGQENGVLSVGFSPDDKHIVSGSWDKTIWDAELISPLEGHSDGVQSVAFSPDGKYIVSGSWDKTQE